MPEPRAFRRQDDVPHAGVTQATGRASYPRSPTCPARPRQRPLGPHRVLVSASRRSEDRLRRRPKVLLAGSYIPRCQRRAPRFRAATGSLEACRWNLLLHGRGPASARLRRTRRTLFTSVTRLTSRPLTPVSPASDPGFAPFPPASRCRSVHQPVKAGGLSWYRTPSASLRSSSDRWTYPGVATRIGFSTPFRLWLLASR